MVRVFGLSLVRDFLMKVSVGTSESMQERQYIRETFLSYINQTYQACTEEGFIVNNVANVMALVVKHDFPEVWPSAFDDLLSLGALGKAGVTVAVRVLAELDFEVVMFSESRTPDEIRHNSIVKDAMRPLMANIVLFLTTSAFSGGIVGTSLSALCLSTLSELIGWVDITLSVNDQVLPQIYQAVLSCEDCASEESGHAEAACLCLLEIAKKGMDPVDKVKLLSSVNFVETLARIPFSKVTSDGLEEDLAAVLDVLFLELLGCWQVFETHMGLKSTNAEEVIALIQPLSELRQAGELAGRQILLAIPLLMKILTHTEGRVAAHVVPSLNKFIQHMKQQSKYQPSESSGGANPLAAVAAAFPDWFFVSANYLNELLAGIFQQLQYSDDFYELYSSTEDAEDDEDVGIEMEAKSQVRKLFVNCCRVYPEVCLNMIASVFSSLPQPLYTAPFPVLEAALRLFHSYGECGPRNLKQEMFPNLVSAIHASEVYRHTHPMVLMIYYDMTQRYASLVPLDMVQNVVASLVSTQGLRSTDAQLRSRSAYFLRKIVEVLRNDAGCLLASTVGSFSDLILTNTSRDDAPLTEQAEMHLLEAVGLMTSAPSMNAKPSQEQLSLLKNMLDILIAQLLEVAQLTEYDPEFIAEIAGRKLSSIAALSKGHSCPKNSTGATTDSSGELFFNATMSIVPVLHAFSTFKSSRSKAIMCLHRIIQCVGMRATPPLAELLPTFIQHSDVTDIEQPIQVLNQLMAEYGTSDQSGLAQNNLNALMEFLDGLYGLVLDRLGEIYGHIMQAIEEDKAGGVPGHWKEDENDDESNEENPQSSLQSEKEQIQKLYVVFIQHITVYGCHPIMLSEKNICRLPDIFGAITSALQGTGEESVVAVASTFPVKRPVLVLLANLTIKWLASEVTVSQDVTNLLASLLCDVAIPLSFRACSDGSVDVKDAVSQGYLGDVGHLVWAMASVKNADTVQFIQMSLLPSLGWPAEAISEVSTMLVAVGQSSPSGGVGNTRVLSNFKDAFKVLVRKLHGS